MEGHLPLIFSLSMKGGGSVCIHLAHLPVFPIKVEAAEPDYLYERSHIRKVLAGDKPPGLFTLDETLKTK